MKFRDTTLEMVKDLALKGNPYACDAQRIIRLATNSGEVTLDDLSQVEELLEDAIADSTAPGLVVDLRRDKVFE